MNVCTVDGCARPMHIKKRGLCQPHYNWHWKHGSLEGYTERAAQIDCARCGTPFAPATVQARYCSRECKSQTAWVKLRADEERYARTKELKRNAYTPTPRKARPHDPTPCTEAGCERDAIGRGMCTMHYKRWARANGRDNAPSNMWGDRRKSNMHARRARMAGARNGDVVLLSQVVERDGTNCSGCGLPVDLTLKHPHRMSKSLDHVVPISKGGAHSLDNAALMHFACNASKGNRTPVLPVPPPTTANPLRVYGPYILGVFSTGR